MSTPSDAPAVSVQFRRLLDELWRRLDAESRSAPPVLMLSAELEIDTPHGRVRLGRDSDGLRHLLVPIAVGQRVDVDRRSAGVHLADRVLLVDDAPVRFADLSCRRVDLTEIFTGLAADVCTRIAADPDDLPSRMAQTLSSWRLLFSGNAPRWTPARMAGLFAELTALERLLMITPAAVGAWLGPTGCAQDFWCTETRLEVKASLSPEGRSIRVHGVDQLDSSQGTLYLSWFRVAESSLRAARTITELLHSCRSRTNSPETLDERLRVLGIGPEHPPVLSETRFEITDERWYRVDETFPRIVPKTFEGGVVPSGVNRIEYTVDLDTVRADADGPSVLGALAAQL
ncbi:PD-(D/E)XK motif protein [Streptomyces hydrogenans]|uniref:PD-(D/E)XK motif protein n=1 Tax=Streptomyces hydrogenans TaxID=1873719 RepID=UPI00365926B1